MWDGLETGTIFARDYRIVRHLASGGMGMVYVVDQISTAKPRALKVMHPHFARDPGLRARFEKEARASGLIDSDHVVEVLAAGIDEATGIPWLVMEYLRGDTLDALIREHGPLALHDALEVARQLHHVLDQAHRQSLVHRDLKPENIFVAQPRRTDIAFTLKVLDFGIAKWVQEAKDNMKNSEVIGTPFWMAPEQLEMGVVMTPAADVWAVGLIMFWVLTGRIYWRSGNVEEASISAILKEMVVDPMPPPSARLKEIDPSQSLPSGFDEWFARTANRDVEQRYATGGDALGALIEILTEAVKEKDERDAASLPIPLKQKSAAAARASLVRSSLRVSLERVISQVAVQEPRDDEDDEDQPTVIRASIEPPLPTPSPAEASIGDAKPAAVAIQAPVDIAQPSSAGSVASERFRSAELWGELCEALEDEINVGELSSAEVQARWMEIAQVRERKLDDFEGAGEAFGRVLENAALEFSHIDTMAEFLARHGETDAAIRVLRTIVHLLSRRGDKTALEGFLQRVFDLCTEADAMQTLALEALERSARTSPVAAEVRSQLVRTSSVPSDPRRVSALPEQRPSARPSSPGPGPGPAPAHARVPVVGAQPAASAAAAAIASKPEPVRAKALQPASGVIEAQAQAPARAVKPPEPAPPIVAPPKRSLAQWRRGIEADPTRPEAWLRCFEAQIEDGERDAAYCVADAAIVVLESAAPERIRAFRAEHESRVPKLRLPRLSEAQWKLLCDPTLDQRIAKIMSVLMPSLAAMKASPPDSAELPPSLLVDPTTSPAPLMRAAKPAYSTLVAAGSALNVPSIPKIYYRATDPVGFRHVLCVPPATIVGGASAEPWSAERLVFAAARHMALYRPELYARVLFPSPEELDEVLSAARTVASGGEKTPIALHLSQRISDAERDAIRAIVQGEGSSGQAMDPRTFRAAVDRTAARAGFFLSRSLAAARIAIAAEMPVVGVGWAADRWRSILFFSISDSYLKLRKELGIALG